MLFRSLAHDLTEMFIAEVTVNHSIARFVVAMENLQGIVEYLSIAPYDYIVFQEEIYKVFWANEIQFRSDHNKLFYKNIAPNGYFAQIITSKTTLPLSEFIVVFCI